MDSWILGTCQYFWSRSSNTNTLWWNPHSWTKRLLLHHVIRYSTPTEDTRTSDYCRTNMKANRKWSCVRRIKSWRRTRRVTIYSSWCHFTVLQKKSNVPENNPTSNYESVSCSAMSREDGTEHMKQQSYKYCVSVLIFVTWAVNQPKQLYPETKHLFIFCGFN